MRLHLSQNSKEGLKAGERFEFINQNQDVPQFDDLEKIFQFGTPENLQEIASKMEKLIICMDVEAWDKAETFAHNIKELLEQAPKDIKKSAFRMEMNVRKGNYEKSMEQYNSIKSALEESIGGK